MQRSPWIPTLGLLCVLGATSWADVKAPDPIPDRVAAADIVIVGKITAIEDKTVMARQQANAKEKTEFKVALVQVAEPLKGAKGLTIVRLGFIPPCRGPPASCGRSGRC